MTDTNRPESTPDDDHRLSHIDVCLLFGIDNLGPDVASLTAVRAHLHRQAGIIRTLAALGAALRRMEQHGWLSSRPGRPTPVRGGRAPILYTLTPQGRAVRDDYIAGLDALRAGTAYAYVANPGAHTVTCH